MFLISDPAMTTTASTTTTTATTTTTMTTTTTTSTISINYVYEMVKWVELYVYLDELE